MSDDFDFSSVKLISYPVPLAEGERCTHDRSVGFNLAVGVIVHVDDWTDCDGDLVINGKTGWRL
jgi:hypothetical protein